MDFKKFSGIENHYRQKFIDKMLKHNPTALEDIWEAREKLDGANIQLVFFPGKEMVVGKRTSYLSPDENFFDIWNTLKKYSDELNRIQEYVDEYGDPVRLYGEIYGPGINGRIDYGLEKKIAIYDSEGHNGKMEAQNLFQLFMKTLKLNHMLPRLVAEGSLMELLQLDVENKNMEGVVIKPWKESYYLNDERFIVKKKAGAFLDKERNEEEPKRENTSDIAYNLNKEFLKYINQNRILDVFAKYGPIQEEKQIGDYIRYVIEDAKSDFLKDVTLPELTKKQEKILYNAGGTVVGYLKTHL